MEVASPITLGLLSLLYTVSLKEIWIPIPIALNPKFSIRDNREIYLATHSKIKKNYLEIFLSLKFPQPQGNSSRIVVSLLLKPQSWLFQIFFLENDAKVFVAKITLLSLPSTLSSIALAHSPWFWYNKFQVVPDIPGPL